MKRLCVALLVFALAAVVQAEEPTITPDTPVGSAGLHRWLYSGNPLLVAWAAYFAHKNHDATIIAEMPQWLEKWPMPPAFVIPEQKDEHQRDLSASPVLAVLDTLIQENAQVSIPAINAVAASFPAQAAVMISRQSLSESRFTLGEWTFRGDPSLVRIATMLLAKDPKVSFDQWVGGKFGFVGSIVADAESQLKITIAADSAPRGLGGSRTCGDGVGWKFPPGWPDVYVYDLVENSSDANGPLIVDVGGDRIATRRYPVNRGGGSCHYPERLNAYTRHRLIAYWLGVKREDMAWQPVEPVTIRWTNKADYEQQVGKIVESQRQKLQATVDGLRQRGVLTGLGAPPKLVVTIECDIRPCPLQ